jgi:hypothetical protein
VNVELTPDQRAFVQKAIESGRFTREEERLKKLSPCGNGASVGGSKSSPWSTRPKRRWRVVKGFRSHAKQEI